MPWARKQRAKASSSCSRTCRRAASAAALSGANAGRIPPHARCAALNAGDEPIVDGTTIATAVSPLPDTDTFGLGKLTPWFCMQLAKAKTPFGPPDLCGEDDPQAANKHAAEMTTAAIQPGRAFTAQVVRRRG